MRKRHKRLLAALVAASAALVALAPSAAGAATCGTSRAATAASDVTFDGIVLSGPRLGVTGDVLEPSTCAGFRVLDPKRYLHTLGGTTTIASSTQGGAAWRAQPLRGPDGLVCVRFQPVNRTDAVDRQAECRASPGRAGLLVGIAA